MAPAKSENAQATPGDATQETKKKAAKKKPKTKPKTKPSAEHEAKHAAKPPAFPASPELARAGTGSLRQLAVPPEGGYSTGHYRVLLETKRVETLCRSLSLQYRHVALLHRLFRNEDDFNTGEITIDEFFHAIHDERRALTLGMLPYVGLDSATRRLSFDQFVLCVVTFAALSRKELLHYAFTLFDKDDSGLMDMNELRDFCGHLKHKNGFFFQKNVDVAQKKLAERDGAHHNDADGVVDLEDLEEGSEHFQVAFFPLMQFQRNIRVAALGEAFWADVVYKKAQIERVVHHMRLHGGHLPSLPLGARLAAVLRYAAFMLTGGGTTTVFNGGPIALRTAAITKYAEEMRQRKLEEEALQAAKEEARLQRIVEEEAEGREAATRNGDALTPVEAYTPSPLEVSHDDGDLEHGKATAHTAKKPAGDGAHRQKKKKKNTPKAAMVAVA